MIIKTLELANKNLANLMCLLGMKHFKVWFLMLMAIRIRKTWIDLVASGGVMIGVMNEPAGLRGEKYITHWCRLFCCGD